MSIPFTKMHGIGNDFVIIDSITCIKDVTPLLNATNIKAMADRHFGVGFDQLLVIEQSVQPGVDFFYRIFNSDGSESNQCGNGVRCAAKYVSDNRITKKNEIVFGTRAGLSKVKIEEDGLITVETVIPVVEPDKIPFAASRAAMHYDMQLENAKIEIGAIAVGNPHAIVLVENIDSAPVLTMGPEISRHNSFPEGANVNFMQIVDRTTVRLRVFERGAGETLACGSGACACVASGILWNLLNEKVVVKFYGGDLTVSWKGPGQPVLMSGPAAKVFCGVWRLHNKL
ncbi:MAG: diaminopimelate epimerase [Gammaproteobacteria bacterium]|nr:diaminopimelate epimerase [Gammaproteobacteria bacterium]